MMTLGQLALLPPGVRVNCLKMGESKNKRVVFYRLPCDFGRHLSESD